MRQRARFFAFFLLVAIGAASQCAQAANLTVNCDKKETIRKTLRLLAKTNLQGPNTVSVSGSCRENLLIQSMDRLTLITKEGASITDRSNGSLAVVDIEDSHSVTLQGFTINGGAGGVQCGTASVCYLTGNTIQDGGTGVRVGGGSHAFLESNVIQNTGFSTVSDGSQMFSSNDVFQGNAGLGIEVAEGAYFVASNSSFLNNGIGILAVASNLLLHGGTISGSVGNGMTLLGGSTAAFRDGTTVTGNGGDGVHLEDASFAGFVSATVTGNLSGLDVNCARNSRSLTLSREQAVLQTALSLLAIRSERPWNKITQPGTTSTAAVLGRLLFLAMSPPGISLVTKISRQRSITDSPRT